VLDGGAERVAEEERVCGEHVVDFRACVARGCPLAVAAGGGSRSSPSATRDPSKSGRVVASRRRSATAHRTDLDRVRDETPSRTPQEAYEIRRRIELYRRRAAGIESRFGGEGVVPERASVFGES
jgi:hypothetical protein